MKRQITSATSAMMSDKEFQNVCDKVESEVKGGQR